MNPTVGQGFALTDVNGKFLATGVVNYVDPSGNFFCLLQRLNDSPIQDGNQIGVDPTTGVMTFTTLPIGTKKNPDGSDPSLNPNTEFVLSDKFLINTPSWPDMTKKFVFLAMPITVAVKS